MERWRAEGLWRGTGGDLGRVGGGGDRSWDTPDAIFWASTVGAAEGVAEREVNDGRMAVRDVFSGVPAPGVPAMSVRGRGEFFRMEVGEDGR